MRWRFGLGLVLLIAAILIAAMPAAYAGHVEAPWCARYSGIGGEQNCGFYTLAQCRTDVSGIGGVCFPNPWFYARYSEYRSDWPRHRRHRAYR